MIDKMIREIKELTSYYSDSLNYEVVDLIEEKYIEY